MRLVDSAEAKPICDYPLKQVPGWRLAKGEFTFRVVDDGRKEVFTLFTGNQAGSKIVKEIKVRLLPHRRFFSSSERVLGRAGAGEGGGNAACVGGEKGARGCVARQMIRRVNSRFASRTTAQLPPLD